MTHKNLGSQSRMPPNYLAFLDDSTAQIFAAENLWQFLLRHGKSDRTRRPVAGARPARQLVRQNTAGHFPQPMSKARGWVARPAAPTTQV